ncbi:hypothetical protein BU17DRAFT_41915 [Hysterangium stoloniferum]|nr:hypothetical protein BU17DRAFT_41915 [Hysterangium stoloniferum]
MLTIPAEINERILTLSEPPAIAAMAQSCTFFRNLIHRPVDQHLWRSLFLRRFDDPRITFSLYGHDANHYPWSAELQRRIRSDTLLTRRNKFISLSPEEKVLVLRTLADAIYCAPPAYLAVISQDVDWVRRLIGTAEIFKFPCTDDTIELYAQMHVYFGLTREEKQMPGAQAMRTESRSFVYDLRKYTKSNLWGPFLRDSGARVSWVHIDHVVNVISMNLEDIVELWEQMRPPTGLEATRPYSAPDVEHASPKDWAGIEGKWYRYVCFMDYRLFSRPNASETAYLNPAVIEHEEFQEAIRLIELNLRVTETIPCNLHPHRPILRFEGASKGAQGNEARVRGTVRMTLDGQVRWKFVSAVSVYDGRTQWISEGIQIGGVASAMGVIGTWTGAEHTERDPVGPFWLWKVKESV